MGFVVKVFACDGLFFKCIVSAGALNVMGKVCSPSTPFCILRIMSVSRVSVWWSVSTVSHMRSKSSLLSCICVSSSFCWLMYFSTGLRKAMTQVIPQRITVAVADM